MRRVGTGLRAFAFCLIPVALVLSHRNLVVVLALVGLTRLWPFLRDARATRLPSWAWGLALLATYAAASVLWSPATGDRDWALRIVVFALLAFAAIGSAGEGALALRVFAGAVLLACLLLGVEAATGGALRDAIPPEGRADKDDVATARGVGLAVAMLPGAVLCLSRWAGGKRALLAGGAAAACLAWGSVRFGVTANGLALAAAMGAGLLAWLRPSWGVTAVAGGFLVLLTVAPLAALLPPPEVVAGWEAGPVSWRQRVVIWRTVGDALFGDVGTFLFGAGQHASAALGREAGTIMLAGAEGPLPLVSRHPHDVFLQVWYEFGLVGAALSAFVVAAGARALLRARPSPGVAAASCALGAATLVSFAVDANLWTLWRLSAVVLGAYGIVLAARTPCFGRRRGVVNAA